MNRVCTALSLEHKLHTRCKNKNKKTITHRVSVSHLNSAVSVYLVVWVVRRSCLPCRGGSRAGLPSSRVPLWERASHRDAVCSVFPPRRLQSNPSSPTTATSRRHLHKGYGHNLTYRADSALATNRSLLAQENVHENRTFVVLLDKGAGGERSDLRPSVMEIKELTKGKYCVNVAFAFKLTISTDNRR